MLRRRFIALGGAALAVPALTRVARADTFPSRFVRLVVPFPPGGAASAKQRRRVQRGLHIHGARYLGLRPALWLLGECWPLQ